MSAIHDLARKENAAVRAQWAVGGSDRYPPEIHKRPRMNPAPKPEPAAVLDDRELSAFDEALDHVNWCRMRSMSPQDISESIKSRHVAHSWGAAIDMLERHILKTRGKLSRLMKSGKGNCDV